MDFAHRFALELNAVGVVHQAIQDGIGQGVVADAEIPLIGGQLADHHGRSVLVTVVHDPQEIVSMDGF